MQLVGPGNSVARGTPMAESVRNSSVPYRVEVCLVIIEVYFERVAPLVDGFGVERLVDVADEVKEQAERELCRGVPVRWILQVGRGIQV